MTVSNALDETNDGSFFNDPKLESGMVLNKRYELLDEIGRGGMGVVWKSHDRIGERTVVLKFVPRELNNFEGAIDQVKASFQLVRDLHHQHADAYSNRSLAYQKKGESEKAKSDRQMHEKLKGQ